MTFIDFLTGSGAVAWCVVCWMSWRAMRSAVERMRGFRRRVAWALFGHRRQGRAYWAR